MGSRTLAWQRWKLGHIRSVPRLHSLGRVPCLCCMLIYVQMWRFPAVELPTNVIAELHVGFCTDEQILENETQEEIVIGREIGSVRKNERGWEREKSTDTGVVLHTTEIDVCTIVTYRGQTKCGLSTHGQFVGIIVCALVSLQNV